MAVRNRIFLLILIMTLVALIVGGIAIVLLYQTALEEEQARLVETAQSQARLIEAMARFDTTYHQDYPGGTPEATLSQIRAAHERYAGFGETGEFTLARLDGDQMVFLFEHRYLDLDVPAPIPFDSDVAEPMRRALSGQSGTVMGLDSRGVRVLAAYEPVAVLDLGIVAKIDLAEIRAPFVKAGLIAGMAAILIVFLGTYLFLRISETILVELVESETRYHNLFENVPVGLNRTTPRGQILEANQALVDMLKYPDKESLLAVNVIDLFANPQDRIQWQELIVQEQIVQGFEVQYRRYDGSIIWVRSNARANPSEDGQVQYYEGSLEDITEQAQAEQRMRELTRQLVTAQETERKHIAQELHDELGQALTAISLDLGRIEQALPPDTGTRLKKMVKEARTLTDEVDERVSELALELRPSLLDDLGLAPTLEWYVDQYSQRLGVAVAMEIKGLEKRLPPEMETGLYRIIQEALTNVARHAQAHSISLHLERSSGMVTVNIADDGRGFDFEKAQGSAGSTGGVGLLGMKERASALGGRFEVHSKPGQGTRIHVEIPL